MWRSWLTTKEAADRLDLSQRQVQRLVSRGQLVALRTPSGRLRVDPLSVELYLDFPVSCGREWTDQTSWSVLYFLQFPDSPTWLTDAGLWRVKRLVQGVKDKAEEIGGQYEWPAGRLLAAKAATRARRLVLALDDLYVPHVRPLLVPSGPDAARSVGIPIDPAPGTASGYTNPVVAERLQTRLGAREVLTGNVQLLIMRGMGVNDLRRYYPMRSVVEADLSLSVRQEYRRTGFRLLQERLDALPRLTTRAQAADSADDGAVDSRTFTRSRR